MDYLKELGKSIKMETVTEHYLREVYHGKYMIGLEEYLKVWTIYWHFIILFIAWFLTLCMSHAFIYA